VVAIAAVVAYVRHKRRPTPEEIERRRRMSLVERGRIGDGMIVDANLPDAPGTVMYLYHVGGVEYVCGQDLSALSVDMETVRVDQPVGVRYDPRNPYNSIITAETWTGLRLK
jgi:hypothetical protein